MITIYGSANCVWCLKCIQLCQTAEMEYEYRLVEDDVDDFKKRFPGENVVPQILWNEEHIGGYEQLAQKVNEVLINENGEYDD